MDVQNGINTGTLSPWIGLVGALFGVLISTIGGLIFGRLVYMSRQIEKDREEVRTEFKSVWTSLSENTGRCNVTHGTISGDIGFIKAKLEDVLNALSEQKKDLWDKADRQTKLMMFEKDGMVQAIKSLEIRMTGIERDDKRRK